MHVQHGHLQVELLLLVLDPQLALALRVDEQREAGRLGHDDAVLDGELVVGQPLQAPLRRLRGMEGSSRPARTGVGRGA